MIDRSFKRTLDQIDPIQAILLVVISFPGVRDFLSVCSLQIPAPKSLSILIDVEVHVFPSWKPLFLANA